MIFLTIAFITLSLVMLIFSSVRYLHTPISKFLKSVFITIKALLCIFLILAFLEPVFKFKQLAPERSSIPVLIDASVSMNQFAPDSSVIPLLTRLENYNLKSRNQTAFSFFLFGDTLRKFVKHTKLFEDAKSDFPNISDDNFQNASQLLVISDGNWTNNSLPIDLLSEKSIYYLQLPKAQRHPFLQLSISAEKNISSDSLSPIKITLDGFSLKTGHLTINVLEKQQKIEEKSIHIDSGSIDATVSLQLPHQHPGKHLYRIEADMPIDTLHAEAFFLQHVYPERFNYEMYCQSDMVDKRFFTIALQHHDEFTQKKPESKSVDLALLFGYDKNSSSLLRSLSSSGIAVYIGCAPCNSEIIQHAQNLRFIKPSNSPETSIDKLFLSELPPVSLSSSCIPAVPNIQPLISASFSNGNHLDTIPVLYRGFFNGINYLALNINNFWRCDFWPLSISRSEEQSFYFSDQLIDIIKDMLLSKVTGAFCAYPSQPTGSSDSTIFSFSFPSDIPLSSDFEVNLELINLATAMKYDTTFKITTTGATLQNEKIFPLKPGKYSYSCRIHSNTAKYSYSDTLFVQDNPIELQTKEQNTSLLNQIGRQVHLENDSLIDQFSHSLQSECKPMVDNYFHISRSWGLLIAIFLLFTIEWGLRKRYDLD